MILTKFTCRHSQPAASIFSPSLKTGFQNDLDYGSGFSSCGLDNSLRSFKTISLRPPRNKPTFYNITSKLPERGLPPVLTGGLARKQLPLQQRASRTAGRKQQEHSTDGHRPSEFVFPAWRQCSAMSAGWLRAQIYGRSGEPVGFG